MPLVTSQFIVAHMPKTGGCWLIDFLRRTGAAQFIGPAHSPITWLPESLRASRVSVGALRDPWSWYVSWCCVARPEARFFVGVAPEVA